MSDTKFINDKFLTNTETFGTSKQSYIPDLRLGGGQLGIGINPLLLDAATPLQFPPAQVFVLNTPLMYTKFNPAIGQMIKAIMETRAKSWSGIDVEYTLNTQSTPIGNDTQELDVPTQRTRTKPSPNATYDEVQGNLIWGIHDRWQNDIQDADTNGAMMGFPDDALADMPYVMSVYSCTLLIVQFDITMRPDRIIDAHILANVYPTSNGPLGIQRQINTTETKERSIQYTAYQMHTPAIREAAIEYCNALKIHYTKYRTDRRAYVATGVTGDSTTGDDKAVGIFRDVLNTRTNDGAPSDVPSEYKDVDTADDTEKN